MVSLEIINDFLYDDDNDKDKIHSILTDGLYDVFIEILSSDNHDLKAITIESLVAITYHKLHIKKQQHMNVRYNNLDIQGNCLRVIKNIVYHTDCLRECASRCLGSDILNQFQTILYESKKIHCRYLIYITGILDNIIDQIVFQEYPIKSEHIEKIWELLLFQMHSNDEEIVHDALQNCYILCKCENIPTKLRVTQMPHTQIILKQFAQKLKYENMIINNCTNEICRIYVR